MKRASNPVVSHVRSLLSPFPEHRLETAAKPFEFITLGDMEEGLPNSTYRRLLTRGLRKMGNEQEAAQLEEEIRSPYPDAIGHTFLLPRAAGAARKRDDQTMCRAATIHSA
jgi:hypothetical protein